MEPVNDAAKAAAGSTTGGGKSAERAALDRVLASQQRRRPAGSGREWSGGRDPTPVGPLVDQLIEQDGWEEALSGGAVLHNWPQIAGEQVAAHCQVASFEDGELVVVADSSVWARELRLLIPQLEAALAAEIGPGKVKSVKVLGPSQRRGPTGPRRVRGR
ncbi:MAG: DciA family protein [Bifidobacteriaceae bacterium]|jgi:predicted nucleic acid-binding Zn ribbon protein|nr:DciA family protein [Bifidobacteriaceae bacterium]